MTTRWHDESIKYKQKKRTNVRKVTYNIDFGDDEKV